MFLRHAKPFGSVLGAGHVESRVLQLELQDLADWRFVVDDEDLW
jgi:hypothetical protein